MPIPPAIVDACTEARPSRGCSRRGSSSASTRSSSASSSPACRIASTPTSHRLPCAARPDTSTSIHTKPRCAGMISSRVGSPTIAASARSPRSSIARVPTLSYSSSAVSATTISPPNPRLRRAPRGGAHRRHAALHVGGAARVQPTVPLLAVERRVHHPFDAHDVEMTAEHQPTRRRARCRCARADWAGPAAPRAPRCETPIHRARGAGARRTPLSPAPPGVEPRISRVDPHERAREGARVAGCNRLVAHPSVARSSRGDSACDSSSTATIWKPSRSMS